VSISLFARKKRLGTAKLLGTAYVPIVFVLQQKNRRISVGFYVAK